MEQINNTPISDSHSETEIESKPNTPKSYIKFNDYYLIETEDFHRIYDNFVLQYTSVNDRLTPEGKERYKIWKRKMVCDYYIDPYITHEEMTYGVDTLRKLNKLRFNTYLESRERKLYEDSDYQKLKDLKIGDPIYYRPYYNQQEPKLYYKKVNRYKGEISKVYKGKWKGHFDIRIGSEHFRRVSFVNVETREVVCYFGVHIPKELKQMDTKQLLYELKSTYCYFYDYHADEYSIHGTGFTRESIKAELSTREHVNIGKKQTREERRLKSMYAKKSKK